jgi:leucyl/phenylalanyl-tRNA--protein transferase
VTVNEDFEGVIHGCSTAQRRNEQGGAWLGPDIIEAFTRLHRLGYAASVEVWEKSHACAPAAMPTGDGAGRRLVGGLYGVTLRKAFFGESMFSLVPNASKLALIHLAKAMQAVGGRFIDCQFETPLFQAMGGRHITYEEYMEMLNGELS